MSIAGQRSFAEVLKAQLEEAVGSRELLELAIEGGITKGRIASVVKKKGWARDLSGKVLA